MYFFFKKSVNGSVLWSLCAKMWPSGMSCHKTESEKIGNTRGHHRPQKLTTKRREKKDKKKTFFSPFTFPSFIFSVTVFQLYMYQLLLQIYSPHFWIRRFFMVDFVDFEAIRDNPKEWFEGSNWENCSAVTSWNSRPFEGLLSKVRATSRLLRRWTEVGGVKSRWAKEASWHERPLKPQPSKRILPVSKIHTIK